MAINYQVKQGDCISSIAFENGFFPDTIWNHPNNAQLKEKRQDPNVLMPGDMVFVPDKRQKEVGESTNQVHKFIYKAAPANLYLHLLNDGEPIANEPFVLEVDGKITEGTTDGEGKLRATILPNAKKGVLIVGEVEDQIKYDLNLGTLAPIDQVSGIKIRLHNLGYKVGSLDEQITEEFKDAISEFEFDHELTQTGQITETNRAKLKELYGC